MNLYNYFVYSGINKEFLLGNQQLRNFNQSLKLKDYCPKTRKPFLWKNFK